MSQQFQIEIVNVGAPVSTPNGRGGFYKSVEVAYKAGGKVAGWTVRDFVNKDVYNALLKAQQGQKLIVTKAKNDKGYDQWIGVSDGGTSDSVPVGEDVVQQSLNTTPVEASPEVTRESFKGRGGRVVGNTYETPEERATRQAIVTRLACVNAALEYTKLLHNEGPADLGAVQTVAQILETFIYTGLAERAASVRATSDSLKK